MEQNQLYTQFYTSQNLNAQFLSPFIGKITHSKNPLQAYRNSDFCVFLHVKGDLLHNLEKYIF